MSPRVPGSQTSEWETRDPVALALFVFLTVLVVVVWGAILLVVLGVI